MNEPAYKARKKGYYKAKFRILLICILCFLVKYITFAPHVARLDGEAKYRLSLTKNNGVIYQKP